MPSPGPGCECCGDCSTPPTLTVSLSTVNPYCTTNWGGSSVVVTRPSDGWTASGEYGGSDNGGSFSPMTLPSDGGTYTVALTSPYGDCEVTVTLASCESTVVGFFTGGFRVSGCQYAPIEGATITFNSQCGSAEATTDAEGVACPTDWLQAGSDNTATATFSYPPRFADTTVQLGQGFGILDTGSNGSPPPAPGYVCWACNLPVCRTLNLTDPSGTCTLTYQDSLGYDFGGGWTVVRGPGWVGLSAGPVGYRDAIALYWLSADHSGGGTSFGNLYTWQAFEQGGTQLQSQGPANVTSACPTQTDGFTMDGEFAGTFGWTLSIVEACGYGYSGGGTGGGTGLPAYVEVTFDSNPIWGSLGGTTLVIDYDPTTGDYPSACLSVGSDGTTCSSAAGSAYLTVTLTPVAPCGDATYPSGAVNMTVQYSQMGANSTCAGPCYSGAATFAHAGMSGDANVFDWGATAYPFTYTSGAGSVPLSPATATMTVTIPCP